MVHASWRYRTCRVHALHPHPQTSQRSQNQRWRKTVLWLRRQSHVLIRSYLCLEDPLKEHREGYDPPASETSADLLRNPQSRILPLSPHRNLQHLQRSLSYCSHQLSALWIYQRKMPRPYRHLASGASWRTKNQWWVMWVRGNKEPIPTD